MGIVSLYSANFSEESWGDPMVFRPERFLDEKTNSLDPVAVAKVMAFGLGKWYFLYLFCYNPDLTNYILFLNVQVNESVPGKYWHGLIFSSFSPHFFTGTALKSRKVIPKLLLNHYWEQSRVQSRFTLWLNQDWLKIQNSISDPIHVKFIFDLLHVGKYELLCYLP